LQSETFNLDGKPDLAVANFSSFTVSTLANNGDGTFAAKVDHRIGATGSAPSSVAVGDFNLDGKPYLAAANYSSNTVGVVLNVSAAHRRHGNVGGTITTRAARP